MIIEGIRKNYEVKAAAKRQSGNPTGSRTGGCAAQMQLLAFPDKWTPEPWQPRGVMATEEGDRTAEWLTKEIEAAYPKLYGLREQAFYFPVPIPDALLKAGAVQTIAKRFDEWIDKPGICSRCKGSLVDNERPGRCRTCRGTGKARGTRVWGTIEPGFVPPRIFRTPEGKIRLQGGIGQYDNRRTNGQSSPNRDMRGIILDPAAKDAEGRERPTVYVPVYIDGMMDHPQLGWTIVEIKSMSNFAFRRALLGALDYQKRCQLVAAIVASGLDSALWVVHRKETSHLGEVGFMKGDTRTVVRIRALNGDEQAYLVTNPGLRAKSRPRVTPLNGDAPEQDFPGDATWDLAYSFTPWDPTLIASMQARILRVLLTDGEKVDREYGPDFRCLKCAGVGTRRCGFCHGSGLSKAKDPRPCPKCCLPPNPKNKDQTDRRRMVDGRHVPGLQSCDACKATGHVDEVELPAFPCGYCPVVMDCWAGANIVRKIDTKPHYIIRREDYIASGLTFTPPEASALEPEPLEDEDEETEEVTS